ncbi:MAG: D-glycero-beta-D-manno-heptose 1-phosphate adenylyltransferase [Candidatus Omnitrophota bacterium]
MPYNKLKTLTQLKKTLKSPALKHKKTVFTNGCFDLMHVGHVSYLNKARSLGDLLIIGLNSDSSVKKLKGSKKPITSQRDRAKVLGALECVDFVTIFKGSTPYDLIKNIKPSVLVKGGDWKVKDIVGSGFVRSYGGIVKSLPYIKGYSTKNIIKKIKSV